MGLDGRRRLAKETTQKGKLWKLFGISINYLSVSGPANKARVFCGVYLRKLLFPDPSSSKGTATTLSNNGKRLLPG